MQEHESSEIKDRLYLINFLFHSARYLFGHQVKNMTCEMMRNMRPERGITSFDAVKETRSKLKIA